MDASGAPNAERQRTWPAHATALGFLISWELASRFELINPVLVSSPSRISVAGWDMLSTSGIYPDLGFTLGVFALSVILGVGGGTVAGLALGTHKTLYQALNPFVVATNALPKIVLMPLIMLWLGVGFAANVFLGALMASFPILVSTFTGVRSLEQEYMVLARSFRASKWTIARSVVLPGVLPYVLSGLRVGVNYALVGALIGEFFGADRGIGYRMNLYMANFQVDQFFVCLVLVALFAVACTSLVHRLEQRVERWRPSALGRSGGM
ncbi:MAG: ABC transporter permease [Planctomycetes bacterium]|nr:ABC transporter permease [Planctomycetota bacterium]